MIDFLKMVRWPAPVAALVAAMLAVGVSMGGATVAAQEAEVKPGGPPTEAPVIYRSHTIRTGLVIFWKPTAETDLHDVVDGVTGYQIDMRVIGQSNWLGDEKHRLTRWVRVYAHHYVNSPGPYEYRVRAFNSHGDGPWSEVYRRSSEASVAPEPQAPAKGVRKGRGVSRLKAVPDGEGTAIVSWKAPNGAAGPCVPGTTPQYRYRYWSGSMPKGAETSDTSRNSVTLSGLDPGVEYTVVVRSYSPTCDSWSKPRKVSWVQSGG